MRAFIIGNGPSLNQHDLSLLQGETTFAVNRIHKIFDRTPWRPTYWVLFDRSKSTHSGPDIQFMLDNTDAELLVRADIPKGGEAIFWHQNYPDRIAFHPQCDHIDVQRNPTDSWHLPQYCKQGGSIPVAIQWAVVKGFNPLYVIGCDLGYKGNQVNHFTPDYIDIDSHGPDSAKLSNLNLEHNHQIARRECDKRGVEIYNAGIGGELGAYPRVDFSDLI